MKKLVIGILAHVDAGKTTLSESLLYLSGKIRKMGRVDHQNAYLDTFELEKARGITIFAKQAILEIGDIQITLLDTPGHVDFSAEMERTLQVLDYAILVINGADGVQGHTRTLWRLLDLYQIPVFLFINKMDQNGTDQGKLLQALKTQLNEGCIDFGPAMTEGFYEQLAMRDESIMNHYLETGAIGTEAIQNAIRARQVFPCFFGSALKLTGIEPLLQAIGQYALIPRYPDEFGAKIFKISRDKSGNRLTHLKLTGGKLQVKDVLTNSIWEEKVNQIRIYSGQKYATVNEIEAGTVCAVTGLSQTRPGEGLGIEADSAMPILEPVLFYQIILPEGCDARAILPKLRQIEEEEPELHLVWNEQLQEIQAQIMGEVQIEILQSLIQSRFGVEVTFDAGKIVYKETISTAVEGVGHFEPLRHYAEVHLLLEPGEPGSGLQFAAECSEEMLGKNWQRLILNHLEEKDHRGVLTGALITDMKMTLVSGRAHNRHTEGGDFREATYRAVRQGLMAAESILLEPYYDFQLELPERLVGRAMTDIEQMHGSCAITQTHDETAVLSGTAPVMTLKNYQKEVMAYTKGLGRLFCSLKGYAPCHNPAEVIESCGYDPERDAANPASSVFCANGTGFLVDWDQVKDFMHVESYFKKKDEPWAGTAPAHTTRAREKWISPEEIDRIFNSTFYANQGKRAAWKKRRISHVNDAVPAAVSSRPKETQAAYLLVDGYNIIFAWPELKEHAETNMDGARMKLLDLLIHYQWLHQCQIIVVFDAYRVQGHQEEIIDYDGIHLVYTREAQTADQYIERFAHDNQQKYQITVATSDGLQQIIIRGAGCSLLSARELKIEIDRVNEKVRQDNRGRQSKDRHYLIDAVSPEVKQQLEDLIKGD